MSCPTVTFSVYTPTYNRAHTLHRTYQSLKQQTFRDFEWLIVDDGSSDGTADLVKTWQRENLVPIRYFQRPHLGAHVAHNFGVGQARGELLTKLDSDDACIPEALEAMRRAWLSIPQEQRESFAGVTVLCKDEKGALVGDRFPQSPLDCSSQQLEYKYRVKGEKWGCVRTDILRGLPFPEDIPGNFIPESYIWSQIGRQYQTRHVNEVLRIYWTDAPSLVHGRPNPFTNAVGHRLMFLAVLNNEMSWFAKAPLRLFRAAAQFARFGWLSGMRLGAQNRALSGWKQRLLWLAALPAAQLMVWRDQRRQSIV